VLQTPFGLSICFINNFTSRNYNHLLHFSAFTQCTVTTRQLFHSISHSLHHTLYVFTYSHLEIFFVEIPRTVRELTANWSECRHIRLDIELLSESESYVTTDGQSASLSWYKAPIRGLRPDFFSPFGIRNTSDSYVLDSVGRPLRREDGSVFCMCRWSLPAQSFSGPSPLGLATVFYCLRFETSLFVASYDTQGHGGGIQPRLALAQTA
jgi:hypothetical protein